MAKNDASDNQKKPRRIQTVTSKANEQTTRVRKRAQKAYYLPLPSDGFVGKLNQHRSIVPGFIKNAWREVRQVTWPNRRETARLTVSVLLFALFFGGLIAGFDYVLDNIFRRIVLGL